MLCFALLSVYRMDLTFRMDHISGEIIRILYSNQQLSSIQPMPVEKVGLFYEALKIFTDMCYRNENLIKFKLAEG